MDFSLTKYVGKIHQNIMIILLLSLVFLLSLLLLILRVQNTFDAFAYVTYP